MLNDMRVSIIAGGLWEYLLLNNIMLVWPVVVVWGDQCDIFSWGPKFLVALLSTSPLWNKTLHLHNGEFTAEGEKNLNFYWKCTEKLFVPCNFGALPSKMCLYKCVI